VIFIFLLFPFSGELIKREYIGELINLSFPSLEQVKIKSFLRTDNALNFVRILEKQELVLEDIELIPAKVVKDLIPRC